MLVPDMMVSCWCWFGPVPPAAPPVTGAGFGKMVLYSLPRSEPPRGIAPAPISRRQKGVTGGRDVDRGWDRYALPSSRSTSAQPLQGECQQLPVLFLLVG